MARHFTRSYATIRNPLDAHLVPELQQKVDLPYLTKVSTHS